MTDTPAQPFLRLPPATAFLAAFITLIQCALALYAFANPAGAEHIVIQGGLTPAHITAASLVTHVFLHAGWFHWGMNTAMLLAFGSGCEKIFGLRFFLFIFAVSALAAAFAQILATPQSAAPMVGASGAISGCFGAVMAVQFRFLPPGMRLRRILSFAGAFILVTIGTAAALSTDDMIIAWAAHLGGFAAGVAAGFFAPVRKPSEEAGRNVPPAERDAPPDTGPST